jgi:hypothetical protein
VNPKRYGPWVRAERRRARRQQVSLLLLGVSIGRFVLWLLIYR